MVQRSEWRLAHGHRTCSITAAAINMIIKRGLRSLSHAEHKGVSLPIRAVRTDKVMRL